MDGCARVHYSMWTSSRFFGENWQRWLHRRVVGSRIGAFRLEMHVEGHGDGVAESFGFGVRLLHHRPSPPESLESGQFTISVPQPKGPTARTDKKSRRTRRRRNGIRTLKHRGSHSWTHPITSASHIARVGDRKRGRLLPTTLPTTNAKSHVQSTRQTHLEHPNSHLIFHRRRTT